MQPLLRGVLIALSWVGALGSSAAFADDAPIDLSTPGPIMWDRYDWTHPYALITHNHVSLSFGDVGIGYGAYQGFFATLSPELQYFVIDRLGVGGLLSTDAHFGAGVYYLGAGPSVSYYPWSHGRTSIYVNLRYVWQNITATGSTPQTSYLGVGAGLNFHATSQFAFGPRVLIEVPSAGRVTVVANLLNLFIYL